MPTNNGVIMLPHLNYPQTKCVKIIIKSIFYRQGEKSLKEITDKGGNSFDKLFHLKQCKALNSQFEESYETHETHLYSIFHLISLLVLISIRHWWVYD